MKFLLDSAIRFGFDLAVKATFVFAATSVALLLMRRSTAATRHRVGTFGLGAALLLPLLSAALPQVNVPILPDVRPRRARPSPPRSRSTRPGPCLWTPSRRPRSPGASSPSPFLKRPSPPRPRTPSLPRRPRANRRPLPRRTFRCPVAPPSRSSAAPSLLLFAWIAGAAAVALRLFVGWSRVRQIGREARPIRDVEWLVERDSAARRLDLNRRVELVESEAVPVAMTFGVLRPLLMFGRAARQWAIERRRVVLLHELAHVKRADWPALLLAELAAAVYWFHPLAWWLTRQRAPRRRDGLRRPGHRFGHEALGLRGTPARHLPLARIPGPSDSGSGAGRRREPAASLRRASPHDPRSAFVSWRGIARPGPPGGDRPRRRRRRDGLRVALGAACGGVRSGSRDHLAVG